MGDVGGRLKTLKFGNESYELGGSMVYQDNMYIRYPHPQPPILHPAFGLLDGLPKPMRK